MAYEIATPVKAGGDQVEDHARAPDASTQKTEHVPRGGPAEISTETDGFSDQRMLHEIHIPDRAGQQSAEREEHRDAVRSEGVAVESWRGPRKAPTVPSGRRTRCR